ncbi:MAG: caspase family protein, partial [Planctomycetota bacterium]|nr:caspase family protein [Planctomycetota bacterium]
MLKQTSFLFCLVLLNAFSEPVPVPGSKKLEVVLPPELAEQWAKGQRRALIVGISDYQHLVSRDHDPDGKEKAYDLKYADRDALAVSRLLEKELGYDSVECLTESKATKDAVSRAISRIKLDSRPLDSVFVFFSGHGFRDHDRSFFMPWDAE